MGNAKANALENAFAYVRGTRYDLQSERALRGGKWCISHSIREKNGLNEPGEDFIGTRVVCPGFFSTHS